MDEKAQVPCKVYHTFPNGTRKTLIANTPEELEGLLRIGWKIDEETDKK